MIGKTYTEKIKIGIKKNIMKEKIKEVFKNAWSNNVVVHWTYCGRFQKSDCKESHLDKPYFVALGSVIGIAIMYLV